MEYLRDAVWFCLTAARILLLVLGFTSLLLGRMPKRMSYHAHLPYRWKEDVNLSLILGLNSHLCISIAIHLYVAPAVLAFYLGTDEGVSVFLLFALALAQACALYALPDERVVREAHRLGISTRPHQQRWFAANTILTIVVCGSILFVEVSRNFIILYYPALIYMLSEFFLFYRENRLDIYASKTDFPSK